MVAYFPAVCVDNFFNDPDYVLNLAKNANYSVAKKNYPGVRSEHLQIINECFFHTVCNKLLSIYYGPIIPKDITWNFEMAFQKITPFENQEYLYPDGWIHADDCPLAGVIYLNNSNVDAGTSLYDPKIPLTTTKNKNIKETFYSSGDVPIDVYNSAVIENNSQFIESISFKNKFNRLVMYEGFQFHAAKNIMKMSEPRYTIVFFAHIISAPYFPIQNIRLHAI
jgi:hypothetical protein